jgi:hypothetical protein
MKGYLFDENLPSRITVSTALPIKGTKDIGGSPSETEFWERWPQVEAGLKTNKLIHVYRDRVEGIG